MIPFETYSLWALGFIALSTSAIAFGTAFLTHGSLLRSVSRLIGFSTILFSITILRYIYTGSFALTCYIVLALGFGFLVLALRRLRKLSI